MDLSYAQRLEDYHLSLAFRGQAGGFYVDVGAGHPVADNVSFWFYLQGWGGLVVEPQARLCDLYAHVRPRDRAVCTLVGRESGAAAFHVVETLHGLSTMVPGNAARAAELGAGVRVERRPVVTLAELLEEHAVGRVDFLKIDVEGAEAAVLAGADWRRWRPRIVVAEAVALNASDEAWREWDALLVGADYRFALFDGLNRFYVAAEEPDLLARLPSEPAPWDAAPHLYAFGRAPESPAHPDHALARALLAALPRLAEEEVLRLLGPGAPSGDALRAALARIAAPYDGGLMLDE